MHVAPRTNALHDLLPHVASFIEVKRAHLLGFLRQVALANIHAIERNAGHDALHLQRFAARWRRPSGNQRLPGFVNILGCEPEFVRFVLRILAAHHSAFHAVTVAIALRSDTCKGCISGTAIPAAFNTARDFGPISPDAVCFSLISVTSTSSIMM